jgi:hypothetical protein
VTPCGTANRFGRFGGPCFHNLTVKMKEHFSETFAIPYL